MKLNAQSGAVPTPQAPTTQAPELDQGAWPAPDPELAPALVWPGDAGYGARRSTYTRVGRPALVIAAASEADVQQAVHYAAEVRRATGFPVPFSVRSGGHGISGAGTNDGGIVLDLAGLAHLGEPDPDTGVFTAQAGARWGEVAQHLAPHDRALTSGNVGGTGVGGIATAGGIGFFARSQGLTLDNVRAVRVVTADGSARWVDAARDPETFWALRGGASHAGVAVALDLHAPRLVSRAGNASVILQEVQYLLQDLPGFLRDWGDWIAAAPREAESFLMLQRLADGRTVVQAQNVWAGDDEGAALRVLEAALQLGQVLEQHASLGPYTRLMPRSGRAHSGQQRIQIRNTFVNHVDTPVGAALDGALANPATMLAEVRALGGAVSDVPAAATAWAARSQAAFVATWARPLPPAALDAAFAPLREVGTGAYGAYSSDTRPAEAARSWPGDTGARLRAVSSRLDPDGLFTHGLTLDREAETGD